MIQLTDAHAHIKNEKQAMERITLGIPTMACAGTPGKMKELEKYLREIGSDIAELISDASTEEKNLLKNRMQVIMQKIQ